MSSKHVFCTKIICADCGGYFGQKVWHSNDKYRKLIWRCNNKFSSETKCSTPALDEDYIKQKFMEAYRRMNNCHEQVVLDVRDMISRLLDTDALDSQIDEHQQEIDEINTLVRAEIQSNATHTNLQDSFDERFERLKKRYIRILFNFIGEWTERHDDHAG